MAQVTRKLSPAFHLRLVLVQWRTRYENRLTRFSQKLVTFLELKMETVISRWVAVVLLLALAKVLTAPTPPSGVADLVHMVLPLLLVAAAPVAGYRIASASFPQGLLSGQPQLRLSRIGQWRPLHLMEARRNAAYGPWGFMASLIFGLLMNVPFRSMEYFMGVPAIGANAPQWAHTLQWAMTTDLVVMNFLYMVCFVLALRSVPLFPRMLVFAWLCDIAMQLMVAQQVGAIATPHAVTDAVNGLVDGNIRKVLISVAIWLPYLILSERVNVTFRHRCSVSGGGHGAGERARS